MGRYRAPSCSTVSETSSHRSVATVLSRANDFPSFAEDRAPVAGPSIVRASAHRHDQIKAQPMQRRDKGKGKLTTPGEMDVGGKERLRMAYKKKELKPVAKPAQAQWSFVYVGNLCSSVTDAQVEALFKPCGPIRRLLIRASGGICVPTADFKRPYFGFGSVDTGIHYATVEFENAASTRQAIKLDGTELGGRKIVVTFNIADLPETYDILKGLIAKKDPHQEKRALWKAKFGQLKRLTIQRTERIPDGDGNSPATFLGSVAQRLGLYEPAGNTAGGAHQKTPRHQLPPAKPRSPFPRMIL